MVTLPEQRLGLLLRGWDLGAGFCLHHDSVDGVCIGLLATDHFSLGAGNRKQNDIVLVLPLRRLAFGGKYADDSEWHVLDTYCLTDGIGVAEKIIHRRPSKHGHLVR